MVTFDVSGIKAQAKENFTEAWTSTAKLIPTDTKISLGGKGKPHLLRELVQKSREVLLNLGFDEVENLTILPDSDVSKQYGPEARVILDRIFYLAELPRPDIGLSAKKIDQVKGIVGEIDVEKLQSILRNYKRGEIEADDLIEEFVTVLKITDYQATELLDEVFPEVKKLRPVPSDKTLRSHMTATWFHTLAALQDKASFPLALFSVGPRYRNEQREDAQHLRVHNAASIVVMDPEMSLVAGREIARDIMKQYGFSDAKFETKLATSKYYASGQEQEVFVKYKGDWVEVADIGMYSPIALANFDIKYPVFNAGFGVERLAMILSEMDDVRKLAYPQFSVAEYSDEDIARSITYVTSPGTARGEKIARAIEESARKHKDEIAPCEFLAWKDESIEVKLIEKETGKRLIGPAGFNEICVADGSIYSDIAPSGVYTGINYMRAIAMGVAALIESICSKAAKREEGKGETANSLAEPRNLQRSCITYQVKTIKHLSDLNLQIPEAIRQYIEGQQRKIGVGGAVFVTIDVKRKTKN
jgi:Phenylalanyl-tRNA synthetase alpha subunit (archaeal type)